MSDDEGSAASGGSGIDLLAAAAALDVRDAMAVIHVHGDHTQPGEDPEDAERCWGYGLYDDLGNPPSPGHPPVFSRRP